MTHGLLQAGIDVRGGVDNHEPCRLTYENPGNNVRPNGEAPVFLCEDVSSNEVVTKLEALGIAPSDDDMVFAGCSPCQYWSKVNTSREKSETSRSLLAHFQHLVETFRPGYVLVENVSGLNTRRDESGLTAFLNFLSDEYTYDEGPVAVYRHGVPQKRHRYLLLATRLGSKEDAISLPEPEWKGSGYPPAMAVREFIGPGNDFPPLVAGERVETPPQHWAANLSNENLQRIQLTPEDGGDRHAWKDDPNLQIDAYRGKDHIFRDVYGRMRWDEPASTITTRFNSLSNGRFGHPTENRAISLREGATLQTFPKTYVFPRNFAEAARQIGNAVPPELARRIGKQIVEHHAALELVS